MKLIHQITTLVLAATLFLIPQASFAWGKADRQKVAIVVVLDDSGAWSKLNKRADRKKVEFLKLLKDLKKRRKTRDAVIDFISSSTGESEFVSNPRKLERDWKQIKKILEGKPSRCNNLADTFATLDSTIREYDNEGYDEIYVYSFSSLIDIPAPCNQVSNLVLPQAPPLVDLDHDGQNDLGKILTRSPKVKTVIFYGVKPEQYEPWHKVIYPKEWVKKHRDNVFRMKKFTKTELALKDGLFIRRDE